VPFFLRVKDSLVQRLQVQADPYDGVASEVVSGEIASLFSFPASKLTVSQFLVGVFASLGSLLYGYDLGVIAQVIASKAFTTKFNATEEETGAVVSVFTGGAFFGAIAAGFLADALGRRMTILTGSVVFTLGGALQTGAQDLSYLYSGRAIAGLGYASLKPVFCYLKANNS
jgi:MFS family permease